LAICWLNEQSVQIKNEVDVAIKDIDAGKSGNFSGEKFIAHSSRLLKN